MSTDNSFQLDDLPSLMKQLNSDKGSCFSALSPNHSFAMDNVLRGHSTRKDKSKTGMGRSARIADQASKVVRQLKKFSPQVDTQLTKEETLQAAAVKATEILTHMPDNNEGIDTTQSISPHWTNHFKKLDIQRTGMISYDDFSDVLITAAVPTYNNYSANATASANTTAHLTSIPVSRKDAYQLALKLDPDKTGLVNYEHLAPALKHAVEETSKAVAEQAVKRLGELSLEQLTNPHLKLQNEEEKQFHHKVSLLKDSELNAGVGAEYGKHNISAVRVGRFSPRFRGDGGNLDSSQGMVTISDVAGKAYGGVDSGSGNGTDLHSLTSPIYNRFKRSVTIEDTLEPPSQGRNSAPLITSPILGNGGHNPCVKSTAPHDHSYNFRDNSGSEYTASLLANTYADNTQFAVIDEISTGRKTHYNANRHTAFAWQFESDRRSKGRGGGSLNGSTAGTLSLGESFQSQQQQIQFRPANSGAIAGAETFDFTDSQSPTNSRAARRSHSAPPIRAKGFKTLGEMGRLNNNNGSDKENEVWSDQQQQQQQLSLNIDTSVAPSPSLSAQADEQSHYDLEHAHSLRTVVFSPKPTTSLLVPSSSSGALKSTRTATTVENEHLSAESRFEKFNIPNSIISQLGGGKRLGSLRHALRQVDGSNSGVVNYSEFREALVNKLGLKLKDSEVRQLYNKNSLTTSGSVADRVTASTVAGSNTNTLGDCREKSVNIDEFVCNLQTRATSHMFGLHKGAVTVMKDATNPHNVIRSTREEERVIKKVLHATNKILCQDPVKVFSDMAKQTNAAKMDRGHSGHSSSETSHRVYSDSLLSDVTLRDFQDGLKYMGADLSDAEFYTLSKVLLTNNNSTNHNKSEHEVDHNFTVDRDNNAGEQVTEVDITNDSTRLNVKNAFDAMNRTVLLVDRVRSQEREDKLQKEGRYSASYKSHPSIVDHYHHHHFDALLENKKVNNDSTHKATTVDAEAAEKASEYTSVGQYKSCVDSSFKWAKLKYAVQNSKDCLLQAFTNQDITVQDLESPPAGLSAENRYSAPVVRRTEDKDARLKTIPFARLPTVLREHGVCLGDDDMHQLQERIRVHQKHGSHAHDSHYKETRLGGDDDGDAEVSLKQICHVVGLPLSLDPRNPRRGVVEHPLETAHQRDGNIFNSSHHSMLATDTFATTYLNGEDITGEETMPWNRGNRKRHVKPMSQSYNPVHPSEFWELSHSGACTAILPTPQRSLADLYLKGGDRDSRAYQEVVGTMDYQSVVDGVLPFTQPEFKHQYGNSGGRHSSFGGSVYSNHGGGDVAAFASAANIGQVASSQVSTSTQRGNRSSSAPPRIRRNQSTDSTNVSSCLDDSQQNKKNDLVTCSGTPLQRSRHASSYRWADSTLSEYINQHQQGIPTHRQQSLQQQQQQQTRGRSTSVTPIGRYRDLGTDTTKANELAVARRSMSVSGVSSSNSKGLRSLGELTGMATKSSGFYSLRRPSHGNTKELDNVMKSNTVAHLLTHSNLHG